MEFHNVKLLPKGLPEIIAQFVPYEFYPDTKIIAHSKRDRRGIAGTCNTEDAPFRAELHLFPTVNAVHSGGIGVYSFKLWRTLLETSLHEIGHLAERGLGDMNQETYDKDVLKHQLVENRANRWRDNAMAKILTVDNRLGQPVGALTGYPGILAYRMRGGFHGDFHPARLAEWRAMKCDAQISIYDILHKLDWELSVVRLPYQADLCSAYFGMASVSLPANQSATEDALLERKALLRLEAIRRSIHRAAKELGITRYSVSKKGRRYLMFNLGEAEAVYRNCLDMVSSLPQVNRFFEWQKVGGFWDIVEVETKPRIPKGQLRLKL